MTKNSVINYTLVVLALLAALTVLNPALAQSANPFTLFGYGSCVDTNTGATSANTLRVLANQGAAGASAWLVTGAGGTFPVTGTFWQATQPVSGTFFQATQPISIADGSDNTLGAQADAAVVTSASGTISAKLRGVVSLLVSGITVATHAVTQSGTWTVRAVGNAGAIFDGATGAAPPANGIYPVGLGSGATGGLLIGFTVGDTSKSINISTATTTLIITGVASRQVHIAAFHLITTLANNVAWIEGTGATCGTGSAGMAGGTTAASGYNLAANGGIAQGTGLGDVLTTTTAGDSVCLVTSAATQLSGHARYAIY